jgi:chromate transporter
MAVGIARAGIPGALAAWLGFTAPSAIALIAFAYGVEALGPGSGGWLHGLKVVAVAVVALAVWGMARSLTPDRPRITLAVLAALVMLAWPTALGQIGAIIAGAIVGRLLLAPPLAAAPAAFAFPVRRRWAVVAWVGFFGLLAGLPLAARLTASETIAIVDSFYRSGSLVFGGGHVVLPLLQAEVVPPGWVDNDAFLAGYGAAQAVPGPLFTFAAYLGTVMNAPLTGWAGGLVCLVAVFLPSFLLVVGALPFWDRLRASPAAQSMLAGVNAAVVGLLLAALYDPVWTSAVRGPADFGLALAAFALLAFWRAPPWLAVVLTAAGGAALAA